MSDKGKSRRFGIRCTLPADDPMAAPHLLGPDWVAERWYPTEEERDAVLDDLSRVHPYSRRSDPPSVIYTKISR